MVDWPVWESAGRRSWSAGYEDPDGVRDPAVQFHEPLSATLRQVAPDAEIYPVE